MRTLSLRAKFLFLLTSVTGVSVLLVAVMTYRTQQSIDEGRKGAAAAASREVMDKIDRLLFERYNDVQTFSISESARSGDPSRLIPFMNDMIGAFAPNYDLMMVTDRNGKVIAVNTVSSEGQSVATSQLLGKDCSKETWFISSMSGKVKTGTSVIEGLHFDSDVDRIYGKRAVMSFSAPIRRSSNGEVVGVWTNRVSWKTIESLLKQSKSMIQGEDHASVFLLVADAAGKVLFAPDGAGVETIAVTGAEQTTAGSISAVLRAQVTYGSFSGEVFESATKSRGFSSFPGMGWTVVSQMPTTDPLHRFNIALAIFAIVLLAAVYLLASMTATRMVKRFQRVIISLSRESHQLKQASSDLTRASHELAGSATQQSTSLQQTASSIEEISSMVSRSAENASRSLHMAGVSQATATRGKNVVAEMVVAIEQISQSNGNILLEMEESNHQLSEIIKVISEIGDKTKVINDIVFQTKLLSFNASVEAARAGEHGKGFAVVAEEVGNLAQMSGNAAKEISTLLSGSLRTVQEIVDATQSKVERLVHEGKSKIETGLSVAKQCGVVLEEIVDSEAQVNAMVTEIATASSEQAQGIGEITKAIGQLDQVTNQNAQIAQRTSGFAETIASRYKALRTQVKALESIVQGRKDEGSAALLQAENEHSALRARESSEEALAYRTNDSGSYGESDSGGKVIPFRKEDRNDDNESSENLTASTATSEFPSESDPRFKEI